MSECSIFCVFAFVYLVVRFQPAAWVEDGGSKRCAESILLLISSGSRCKRTTMRASL